MSDYLKGKRVVDPVLTSIARGYKMPHSLANVFSPSC